MKWITRERPKIDRIEITALHNHFFFGQPKVYFMHISGMGSVDQLASGAKKVYDKIVEIRASRLTPTTGCSKS